MTRAENEHVHAIHAIAVSGLTTELETYRRAEHIDTYTQRIVAHLNELRELHGLYPFKEDRNEDFSEEDQDGQLTSV